MNKKEDKSRVYAPFLHRFRINEMYIFIAVKKQISAYSDLDD